MNSTCIAWSSLTLPYFCVQNCYAVYGGQQFSPYYPSSGASGPVGLIHNIYPFSAQYAHNNQGHGFGVQYPQMMRFPLLPRQYGSAGILTFPSSMAMPITSAGEKPCAKTCDFFIDIVSLTIQFKLYYIEG